jgi:cellulose synthase/poly-beta-1,6-N-acetylglucosamine synthase-like glycosyltransferase
MAFDLGIAGAMLHGVDGQLQPNVECLGSNRWLTKKNRQNNLEMIIWLVVWNICYFPQYM